jgi:hypothetical protein
MLHAVPSQVGMPCLSRRLSLKENFNCDGLALTIGNTQNVQNALRC